MVTLFCLVQDDSLQNAFEITIEKNKSVYALQNTIKEVNKHTFSKVDAKDLSLWKINIITTGKRKKETKPTLQKSNVVKMLSMKKISRYFPDNPLDEHIHIIVEYSSSKCHDFYLNILLIPPDTV
jgi:hypothetical protein